MSLEILSDNWDDIKNKVIEPLWKYKFSSLYNSVKMDKADFESLAGEVLTKAFMNYNPATSNVFTYSKMVIVKKAQTEIRDKKREKRIADVLSESLNQQINEDSETTLEDTIEDIEDSRIDDNIELAEAINIINRHLLPKERKIVKMSLDGYDDKNIASALKIDRAYIQNMKKKLNNSAQVRRIVRLLGYLGGTENEA